MGVILLVMVKIASQDIKIQNVMDMVNQDIKLQNVMDMVNQDIKIQNVMDMVKQDFIDMVTNTDIKRKVTIIGLLATTVDASFNISLYYLLFTSILYLII